MDDLAAKLDMHPNSIRAWINGNRDLNLVDFFRLCSAGGIDPQAVLFTAPPSEELLAVIMAWEHADENDKRLLTIAARAVLGKDAVDRIQRSDP
jgi:hypothetical protein